MTLPYRNPALPVESRIADLLALLEAVQTAGGVVLFDTAGNPDDDATVQVSVLPEDGAVVPPEATVVSA